ncbi:bifunctional oligoribonuclease/PAP phosphatase NrnA [Pontibacter locisalis]|uniref:Bifunctional oligoribonuclease/PAP phosphatase NrnA n=1 Tax=Pontibacter locisalis TaxID=1719035 RepID=A0ABW5IJ60_9BACT
MHNINALQELLKEPKEVMITTHHKPDADALGSSLGLAGYLKKKGHRVTVITPSDYPSFLNWMEGNDDVIVYSEKNDALVQRIIGESQVIFCLDFNNLSRINEMGEYIRSAAGTKILVDHHLQPDDFADLDYANTQAAATAEIVYDLIKAMGDGDLIDTGIGECLYAGIMTDTGSFRHPSTSKNVHLIIADLLQIGVRTSNVHRLIYDSSSELRLRFLGYALKEKLVVLPEYKTAYFAITADELKAYDSKTGDTEGLVNYALSIEGIVFAALIIDRTQAVKMSFRSVGDFSANEFARENFNGGGHKNAAGGMSMDSLEATVAKFESLLPLYKDKLKHATDTE